MRADICNSIVIMAEVEMDRNTVLLMIMQYLKANLLTESFETLQREAQLTFSLVYSKTEVRKAILEGAWEKVLVLLKNVSFPDRIISMLYCQIIQELCSNREFDLAAYFLRENAQKAMASDRARYTQLLGIIKSRKLEEWNVEQQRYELADEICSNTIEINSNTKLMDLICLGSLREYQDAVYSAKVKQPKESASGKSREAIPMMKSKPKELPMTPYITTLAKKRSTDEKYHLKTAAYSPDGSTIATGSIDGFIEILDAATLEVREDLGYQQVKQFMLHEHSVLSLAFTSDGNMLCAGDASGLVKIWRITDGKCLRKLLRAHNTGVACCKFMAKNSQVVSGCYGGLVRIHGLRSGALLKEFRGHTSYIVNVLLLDSESALLSAAADGTVRVWDVASSTLRMKFAPRGDLSINSIWQSYLNPEHFLICTKSCELIVVTRNGELVQGMETEEEKKSDFIEACYSSDGHWVYAAAQNLRLYVFDAQDGKLMKTLDKEHDKEILGLVPHPVEAKAVTYGMDGYLILWEA
eukprot:TRINITY_DN14803_c0_g1_i2.p1 TRINITY_DN14803_c0_g1~~TRINITY_DN14803_c0_g1_i2.p1  ORF type:complete len:525 (-),score=116.28 TRINITY_DN14803_c0_g1_i2:171-1745(-)